MAAAAPQRVSMTDDSSRASPLSERIAAEIHAAGGWLPFDRFMALALYAPGLGYYSGPSQKFGLMPQSGSDFVTAPELSPLFGPRAVSPGRPGPAGLWLRRGLGIRRRHWRLGRAVARRPGRADSPLSHRRSLRHPARPARPSAWPPGVVRSSGWTNCPSSSTASSSATRCWTPCRCSSWPSTARPGPSAVWSARPRVALLTPTVRSRACSCR